MTTSPYNPPDPAELAESVRLLASQAHRAVNAPVDGEDVHVLARRIAHLQQQSPALIARWLENLQRRLEPTPHSHPFLSSAEHSAAETSTRSDEATALA